MNKDKQVTEDSIIKVEHINGPILLLSSINDSVWPSTESARGSSQIETRLIAHNFKFPHKHIAYKHISHMMMPDISPAMKLVFKSERHAKAQCQKERIHLAATLLNWIENTR
ncbi:MAG: hypothetical protein E7256_02555 [Lachnospiraceae bacterium]|nr:hypothetical protein [Lachnospiraceae bacterium]